MITVVIYHRISQSTFRKEQIFYDDSYPEARQYMEREQAKVDFVCGTIHFQSDGESIVVDRFQSLPAKPWWMPASWRSANLYRKSLGEEESYLPRRVSSSCFF